MISLTSLGCDYSDKIARLEKQNEELQAQINRQQAANELDLQAKCSRDAKTWFNENWPSKKDTILLNYTNHYNKALNKCFILVEYHYSLPPSSSWVNSITLYDIYENVEYGSVAEHHMVYAKPFKTEDFVITCKLLGKDCKTVAEFNMLISSYLNN